MQIIVNGENKDCSDQISVSELLESLGVDKRYVAVEVNRSIVPRSQFSEKKLRENDSLEIVTFVGGG